MVCVSTNGAITIDSMDLCNVQTSASSEPNWVGMPMEPRIPLNRDRVLRAAIVLADAQGLESLTMRKLAQTLGVEAMTLYHYVANKREMLGGIVDLVVEEIELPSPDSDWKAAIRATAISTQL